MQSQPLDEVAFHQQDLYFPLLLLLRHKFFAIGNIEMGGRGAEVAKTADRANDFVNDCTSCSNRAGNGCIIVILILMLTVIVAVIAIG